MTEIIPQKTCSQCKVSLPATGEFWHRTKATKDGWCRSCRDCARQRREKSRFKKLEFPCLIGIYRITCTPTGKIYIGQSKNLQARLYGHKTALISGRHDNKHLLSAWDKYGEEAFLFEIIEICEYADLTSREQYWLDLLQPFDSRGFNVSRVAQRAPSAKGVKRSLETRLRQSIALKGRYVSPELRLQMSLARKGIPRGPLAPEHCANISRGSTGLKKSAEHVEKMAQTKRKKYIVTSPDGQEILIDGMRKFCAQHDLHNAAMIKVAQGVQTNHKGWKCKYA